MSKPVLFGVVCAMFALGCGSDDSSETVAIEFAALVDGAPYACGTTYDGLGADDTSLELTDFRFYVQDVELKTESGDWVPVELSDDIWQTDGTILMDFEDGCGDFGNPELNSVVNGRASGGPFVGVRFAMGVPFAPNHEDPVNASSPLNLTTMHWNWQGGYKFLRVDSGSFDMSDWRMHLGSTGCDGDQMTGGTTSCANPNRVAVEFDGFDWSTQVITADFARLVEGAPLDDNQEGTPVGCMSGPGDSDCSPIFDNLGLAFGGEEPSGDQIFFATEDR